MTDEELLKILDEGDLCSQTLAADRIRELLKIVAVASAEGTDNAEVVVHKKRGSEYRVFPIEIELQSSGGPVAEGARLTMYVDRKSWKFWARPTPEFRDGRFVTTREAGL